MKQMTKGELQVRNREIQDRMAEMNEKAYTEKREFNAEEKAEWGKLSQEAEWVREQIKNMATGIELAKIREHEDKNAKLRELLKDNGQKREILLWPAGAAVWATASCCWNSNSIADSSCVTSFQARRMSSL